MRRENESVATYKNLAESRNQLAQKELAAINEKSVEIERFKNDYYARRDMRNRKEASKSALMEAARNEAFSTIIKAIYIGALEASTLTDDGIILAESMVDKWIVENGGASTILSKVGNKTYLLSRITQIVEDAAEADVKEIESEEPVEDSKDNDDTPSSKKKDAAIAAAAEFLKTARKKDVHDFMSQIFTAAKEEEDRKSEEAAEKREEKKAAEEEADNDNKDVELQLPKSSEGEEKKEEKSDEDDSEKDTTFEDDPEDNKKEDEDKSEDESEEKKSDEDDDKDEDESKDNDKKEDESEEKKSDEDDDKDEEPSKEEIEDHVEDELGEPLDDDGIDQDTTIDGHTGNDGKIFDELNKEEDVQKAVEIIRSRIADAEETFIRNNAEDKKKIDELLNKISNNVKTIEDLDGKDETKTKIAEESVRAYKRHIDSIKENRNMTIFEKMSRNLSKSIIKDESVRESYITESGTLDTDLIIESSKVMYGFLETINTLQLDKVDSSYIKKVLDGMN